MELEEYAFDIEYLPVEKYPSTAHPPSGRLEENIYKVVNENFCNQLNTEQDIGVVIKHPTDELLKNGVVSTGRLKRVNKQLRIEDGILT